MRLNVLSPNKDWRVFANGAEKRNTADEADVKAFLEHNHFTKLEEPQTLFEFEDCPAVSTYLYGMDAGPFAYVKNDNKDFKVPIAIGIRKSKLKFLDAREFFRILEASILFYEDFFGTPYQF